MTKPRKAKLDRSLLIPIISNAAIAGPVADGRLLPLLILDTSSRPEIAELIRVHEHLPAGDARSQWASSQDNNDDVMLLLNFERPVQVEIGLRFSIEREAILVETMLSGGAVYLQVGQAGDRLSETMGAQRLLVELPDTGFGPIWSDLLLDRMTVVMAGKLGVPRRQARPLAEKLIEELRTLARLRMHQ